MKSRTILLTLCWLVANSVSAHHSFSTTFDDSKPATVEGYVTNIKWANPHVYISLDVEEDDGQWSEWSAELLAPGALTRGDWTLGRDTLAIGELIEIEGDLARNGSNLISGRLIRILATGQELTGIGAGER